MEGRKGGREGMGNGVRRKEECEEKGQRGYGWKEERGRRRIEKERGLIVIVQLPI